MSTEIRDEANQRLIRGSEWLQECLEEKSVLLTGVSQLDKLFGPGLLKGDIVEIIGSPESGKTILLYTIMLSVLEKVNHLDDFQIMFIDCKYDFQAIKLKNMMNERKIPYTVQNNIMKRVLVQRVKSLEELISTLKFVVETSAKYKKVTIVMVDSITVLYYLYLGRPRFVLSLLTKVADLIKILSLMNVNVFVTNLAINIRGPTFRSTQSTSDGQSEGTETTQSSLKIPEVKAAIGRYWQTVAHHKVLIDFVDYPHQFEQDRIDNVRHISLFHSKTFQSTSHPYKIQITRKGIIG